MTKAKISFARVAGFSQRVKNDGYTLIELLVVLAIVGILFGLSQQMYIWHIVTTRRTEGQLSLLQLSSALENYYLQHNSYQGATLSNMNFAEKTPHAYYQMSFVLQQNGQSYIAKATPLGAQAKQDKACGVLILMTDGRRTYQGDSLQAVCW